MSNAARKPTSAWPADKVERWPIDKLVLNARNARTHSETQVDQIAASIREWGWTSPVLVTEAYVWHAGRYASTVQESLAAVGFDVRSQIIWAKDRFALSRGNYHWQHEPCWYAVRNGPAHWTGDRKQSTLWQIPAREGPGFEHGTQKPVECMKRPIENNSSPGQAVYEPFSGSGTTIIACEITGRMCHAIELMPQYVDVGIERWQAFTGETAKLEADGRGFHAVAAERREG
jgi:DNA modification methylase